MVERSLSMREVQGSIPCISIFFPRRIYRLSYNNKIIFLMYLGILIGIAERKKISQGCRKRLGAPQGGKGWS